MSNKTIWQSYAVHDDRNVRGFFGPYRFLGNFEKCPVYFESWLFPSPEHAYQFAKILPAEPEAIDTHNIRNMSAKEVKVWGNKVARLRLDWEAVKYDVMAAVVFDKYYRYPHLRAQLVNTGNKYLEETNHWHDNYYGNCVCEKCKEKVGKNKLGLISMYLRTFWRFNESAI